MLLRCRLFFLAATGFAVANEDGRRNERESHQVVDSIPLHTSSSMLQYSIAALHMKR